MLFDLKRNWKYHTFSIIKGTSPPALSVHNEQLCRATTSEKVHFSWIDLLKKKPRRTWISIFPVRNKILKFWDMLFECVKRIQKPRSKLKIYILNFYREYLLCPQSSASSSSPQKCINFVEQLRFSHFEGSIIP